VRDGVDARWRGLARRLRAPTDAERLFLLDGEADEDAAVLGIAPVVQAVHLSDVEAAHADGRARLQPGDVVEGGAVGDLGLPELTRLSDEEDADAHEHEPRDDEETDLELSGHGVLKRKRAAS
jgi:hypothetical protein